MAKNTLKNSKGYTMAEAIAVLILLGIMAVVVTPKFFDLQSEAEKKVLHAAVAQLNAQATMAWVQCRIKPSNQCATEYEGYPGDLGEDFILSGQIGTPNMPGSGFIKLVNGKDTYSILWTDIANDSLPGRFTLAGQSSP